MPYQVQPLPLSDEMELETRSILNQAALTHRYLAELIDVVAVRIANAVSVYQKKIEALEELKKATLQKAFSGKLTNMQDQETNTGAVA